MQNLTQASLKTLIKKTGRHSDGGGLYFRVIGGGKSYWTYRYRVNGKERETSIGPYPEITMDEARTRHAELRKQVRADKIDPIAQKRAAKANATAADASAPKPTFGECADAYIATHDARWRNATHREQWRSTLRDYCNPIRDMPVDKIDTAAVLRVLKPLWTRAPETASRLRGRIESVLNAARALGHIDPDRANPARWKGHLDQLLPKRDKLSRGHHAALPYADLPAFMTRLGSAPGTVAKALAFIVLTAARSGEALGMTWDEVSFDDAVWRIPASRMKAGKEHVVPLSDQAVSILRGQYETSGKNPHVFPSHLPRQALSSSSTAVVIRRLGTNATTHGMRASFRMWAADQGIAFEVAEQALAHVAGGVVVAYQRSPMVERRRPVMQEWADFVTSKAAAKIVALSGRKKRS